MVTHGQRQEAHWNRPRAAKRFNARFKSATVTVPSLFEPGLVELPGAFGISNISIDSAVFLAFLVGFQLLAEVLCRFLAERTSKVAALARAQSWQRAVYLALVETPEAWPF